MSAVPITLDPAGSRPASARTHGRGCPLASNCSCIFQRIQPAAASAADTVAPVAPAAPAPALGRAPATAQATAALAAETATWLDWGWSVARDSAHEVVLERTRKVPFCLDFVLTVLTAGLWLFSWVPRARHPRVDTVTLSLAPDGTVSSTSRLR